MVFEVKSKGIKRDEAAMLVYLIRFSKNGHKVEIQLKARSLADVLNIIKVLFSENHPVTIVAA
jgi:hypothetical protein